MNEFEVARYESRRSRIGTCRACGEPVLWVRTNHGSMAPLDPVPVVVLSEILGEAGQFYVTKGAYSAAAIDNDANVYRLHNDGACIERIREDAAKEERP